MITNIIKSSNSETEKANTDSIDLETIRSLSQENTAIKVNLK